MWRGETRGSLNYDEMFFCFFGQVPTYDHDAHADKRKGALSLSRTVLEKKHIKPAPSEHFCCQCLV